MLSQSFLTLLSLATFSSALPKPAPLPHSLTSRNPSCGAGQVGACCDSVTTNGTGLGCIFSTLNVIPLCDNSEAAACCDASQTALIAVGCVEVPISVKA